MPAFWRSSGRDGFEVLTQQSTNFGASQIVKVDVERSHLGINAGVRRRVPTYEIKLSKAQDIGADNKPTKYRTYKLDGIGMNASTAPTIASAR